VIVRIILQPFSYLALYWSPRRLSHFGWNGMQSQPGLWSVRSKIKTKTKKKIQKKIQILNEANRKLNKNRSLPNQWKNNPNHNL